MPRKMIALIIAEGHKAVAIPGDIRTEDFGKQLVDQAVDEPGGLGIDVNNAARTAAAAEPFGTDDRRF